jgi:LCP family protein required for cell wall assembly
MCHVSDKPRRARKPRRGHGLTTAFIVIAVIVGTLAGAVLWYVAFPGDGEYFSVLLIGEDRDYARNGEAVASSGRMDTIMLLIVPRSDHAALLVSIPRDTLVSFPNGGRRRVNSAMGLGGMDLAHRVVSDLVGLDIHRHAAVDFSGFTEIVDAVGGVDITVDKPMKYTDRAGGYSIDLKPGAYHMDGETALSYVRYRQDALGDISRASRQQRFFRALLDELASWRGIRSFKKIAKIVQDNTNTDLSVREMAAIGWRLRSLDSEALQLTTLPGRFKGACWEPDYEAIRALVEPLVR